MSSALRCKPQIDESPTLERKLTVIISVNLSTKDLHGCASLPGKAEEAQRAAEEAEAESTSAGASEDSWRMEGPSLLLCRQVR